MTGNTVIVTDKGRKYHADETCAAYLQGIRNSRDRGHEVHAVEFVSVPTALRRGKQPCSRCAGGIAPASTADTQPARQQRGQDEAFAADRLGDHGTRRGKGARPGTKLNSGQVGAAGEHFVAAEIHRRGGYAVTFSGNMKGIDLLASDAEHRRTIGIQVKTRTSGTWHANTARDAHQRNEDPLEEKFWIFVDLSGELPSYYVAPAWWVENDIDTHHQAYLTRHGGKRAVNNQSTHHAIQLGRLQEWHDRWDVLGILPTSA